MEHDIDPAQDDRAARLKGLAEKMGLIVDGSTVIAPLAKPIAVDASAVDLDKLAASLMYLAFQAGRQTGRREIRDDLCRLLDL